MRIAAIDSAERSGLALLEATPAGERLISYDVVTIATAEDVERVASELAAGAPDVVAIEEPFSSPRFPGSGMSLARLLGRWLQAFERREFVTLTVPASMWQRAVLPGITHRSRSADRKVAAQAVVLGLFGALTAPDAADAIGLALYVARNATVTTTPTARRIA